MPRKAVLAYSGGLDTSIIIPWLKEHHDVEVHCLAGDVGQGPDELVGLEDKAAATGAASCRVADLKQQFLEHCVWPCLRALCVYEGRYLLGTSMARPVLAQAQVDYAREVGADMLVHGCTGRGNDQVRFELAYQTLAPEMEIVAPWRDWDIQSREDALEYAQKKGIPVSATTKKIYSRDRNLWHISHEGGPLEDPGNPPPDDVWMLTTDPKQAPDEAQQINVGFERGAPVSLDGQRMDAVELVETLNQIAGKHGVGRVDITENRLVGMKSRGAYETPAGTVLYEALRTLASLTQERETARSSERLALEYGDLVYNGCWFHPLRRAIDGFFDRACQPMTGHVTVELWKGNCTAMAASSPYSLYAEDLATFGAGSLGHQESAGFLRLYGLPAQVAARVHGAEGERL